jgi:hypothetical protein
MFTELSAPWIASRGAAREQAHSNDVVSVRLQFTSAF